jgi:hypothetical protein
LVIQVHGSKIATSEEKVADWKTLINQWRNEHSRRDELSHHLVFTKNDEEPGNFGEVCMGAPHGRVGFERLRGDLWWNLGPEVGCKVAQDLSGQR